MKTYGGVSALDGGEWSASCLYCFTLWETFLRTHYVEGWGEGVAPELIWTLWRKETLLSLPGIEPRILGHPGRILVTIPTDRTASGALNKGWRSADIWNNMVSTAQNRNWFLPPLWPHLSRSKFSCDRQLLSWLVSKLLLHFLQSWTDYASYIYIYIYILIYTKRLRMARAAETCSVCNAYV
jgi:hypothetical protein